MFRKRKIGIWLVLLLAGLGTVVLAADPAGVGTAAANAANTGVQSFTVKYVFEKGGFLMWVLSLMSVAGLALIIYYSIIMRREQVAPQALRREVTAKIAAGDLESVRQACGDRPCPLAEITLAAVDYVESSPNKDLLLLKEMIEGEGTRQGIEIQTQAQYLLDLAVLSPMVGLLGSVFGMLQAFNAVALDAAKAKPMLLAAGVSEALFCTAGGLIVGIIAMGFYGYFRSRSARLVSYLEAASADVLTAFLRARRS